MPLLQFEDLGGYHALDSQVCQATGLRHADSFRAARPFPHVVLDDFVDASVRAGLRAAFDTLDEAVPIDRATQRGKRTWSPRASRDPLVRSVFAELAGPAFLEFMQALTGAPDLVPDPWLLGAGLHELSPGGHLGIHADFNLHSRLRMRRRYNLMLYLNEDWRPEDGGALQLWSRDMRRLERVVEPVDGRAVVFATGPRDWHGHPDPIGARPRRSLSLYYYDVPEQWMAHWPRRAARFAKRPGSRDPAGPVLRMGEFVTDLVPPLLYRGLRGAWRRVQAARR